MTSSLLVAAFAGIAFPFVMELHTAPEVGDRGGLDGCTAHFDGGLDLVVGLWEVGQVVDCNGEIQRYLYAGTLAPSAGALGLIVARHLEGGLAFSCEVGEGADLLCGAEEGELFLPPAMIFALKGGRGAWVAAEVVR